MPTTIHVCSDNALMCDLLVGYLRDEDDLDVVCVADVAACPRPTVLLLDAASPVTRLDEVAEMRAAHPDLKVVVFGMPCDPDTVLAFAQAGATAILPLDSTVAEVITAIRDVCAARVHCSEQLGRTLLAGIALTSSRVAASSLRELTPREKEIAACLQQGLSNKEIARSLSIEVATTKNHVHNLLRKMGVASRGKAAAALKDIRVASPYL